MTFYRVLGNPNSVLPDAVLTDRALDSEGYLWWRGGAAWRIERRIIEGGAKLLDVQGEPTLHQGADGDVAVAPRGKCWFKKAGAWQYEDDLGEACERLVKTDSLIVLGNLSLPIVDGRIPLFDPYIPNKIVGYLKVEPIN